MQYSNDTNQILISMLNGTPIDRDIFDPYVLGRLYNDRYIQNIGGYHSNDIVLSDAGKAYVESLLQAKDDKKYSRFRDNVNLFLAIFGIVLSIIAIIISIVKP